MLRRRSRAGTRTALNLPTLEAMGRYTTRLYARPSYLSGAARTLDIGGTFDSYVMSRTPQEADLAALASDFMATADDFRRSADEVAAQAGH